MGIDTARDTEVPTILVYCVPGASQHAATVRQNPNDSLTCYTSIGCDVADKPLAPWQIPMSKGLGSHGAGLAC